MAADTSRIGASMSTILVVDDEQSFRSLLSEALGSAGYSVLVASNGAEALEIAKEKDFQLPLVVTDFTMPGMSGIELLRTLRESRPEIKAVLLTGHWIHPVPEDINAVYLMKPCPVSKLVATVKQLLAGSSASE